MPLLKTMQLCLSQSCVSLLLFQTRGKEIMIGCYYGTLISGLNNRVKEVIPRTPHPQRTAGAGCGSAVGHRQPMTEWSYPVPQSPEVSQPDEDLHLQVEEPELVKVIPTIVYKGKKENAPFLLLLILKLPVHCKFTMSTILLDSSGNPRAGSINLTNFISQWWQP